MSLTKFPLWVVGPSLCCKLGCPEHCFLHILSSGWLIIRRVSYRVAHTFKTQLTGRHSISLQTEEKRTTDSLPDFRFWANKLCCLSASPPLKWMRGSRQTAALVWCPIREVDNPRRARPSDNSGSCLIAAALSYLNSYGLLFVLDAQMGSLVAAFSIVVFSAE